MNHVEKIQSTQNRSPHKHPIDTLKQQTNQEIQNILEEITIPYNYIYGIFEDLQLEISNRKNDLVFDYSNPLYEILLSQKEDLVKKALKDFVLADGRLYLAYEKARKHLAEVFGEDYAEKKLYQDYLSNAVYECIKDPITEGIDCKLDLGAFKKAHGKIEGLGDKTMFDFSKGSFAGMNSGYIRRIFEQIPQVRHLTLNDCELYKCNAHQIRAIFHSFPHLNGLSLHHNDLQLMHESALRELALGLKNIKSLSLRGTNIAMIHPYSLSLLFQNMTNVTKLDLGECNFGALTSEEKTTVLSYLRNLRCIIFDKDFIEKGNCWQFLPAGTRPQIFYRKGGSVPPPGKKPQIVTSSEKIKPKTPTTSGTRQKPSLISTRRIKGTNVR